MTLKNSPFLKFFHVKNAKSAIITGKIAMVQSLISGIQDCNLNKKLKKQCITPAKRPKNNNDYVFLYQKQQRQKPFKVQ